MIKTVGWLATHRMKVDKAPFCCHYGASSLVIVLKGRVQTCESARWSLFLLSGHAALALGKVLPSHVHLRGRLYLASWESGM